jgi:hypothetical protein
MSASCTNLANKGLTTDCGTGCDQRRSLARRSGTMAPYVEYYLNPFKVAAAPSASFAPALATPPPRKRRRRRTTIQASTAPIGRGPQGRWGAR